MILLYYTLFYRFLTNFKLVCENDFITANTKLLQFLLCSFKMHVLETKKIFVKLKSNDFDAGGLVLIKYYVVLLIFFLYLENLRGDKIFI